MSSVPPFSSSPSHPLPPARPHRHDALTLRRLLWLRWGVLAGQGVILWLGHLFGMHLPVHTLLAIMALEGLVNLASMVRLQALQNKGQSVTDGELAAQLLFDLGALSALLYFTGGAINPFVPFYLPSLAIAAALLPWWQVAGLALLAFGAYSAMLFYYQPLHLHDPDSAVSAHLGGMWLNFIASAALLAGFVARLSGTLRQRDAELAAAREQLLRDERMEALGAQAASAAHEIGTPLATIAVVTGELRRDALDAVQSATAIGAYAVDLVMVEQQLALCKAALGRLQVSSASQAPVRLDDWLPGFARNWRLRHPQAELELAPPVASTTGGALVDAVAVGQILTILLDNAAQSYAVPRADAERVATVTPWIRLDHQIDDAALTLTVVDHGRGMPAALLAQLGRKPVPSASGGQGVGLFLAQSVAQRLGGGLAWHSAPGQGTRATLRVPLVSAHLEAQS